MRAESWELRAESQNSSGQAGGSGHEGGGGGKVFVGPGEGEVLQPGDGFGAVREARIERRRGEAEEIGSAKIGDDVRGLEGLAKAPGVGMREGEMAAAGGGAARGGDGEAERGEIAVDQGQEKIGEREGFGAEGAEAAGFGDEFKGAEERGEREEVRRADVEGRGAGGGFVVRGHDETAVGAHAPPAREAGGTGVMATVEKKSADGAGAGVEPFVIAPEGEVRALVAAERVRHGTDAVRKIPADEEAALAGFAGERGDVEELAAGEDDGWEDDELDVGGGEGLENIVEAENAAVAGWDEAEMGGGIEAAEAQVGLERVGVGGEIEGVAEDDEAGRTVARVSWPVVMRMVGRETRATGFI